jgi:hypothetical protein
MTCLSWQQGKLVQVCGAVCSITDSRQTCLSPTLATLNEDLETIHLAQLFNRRGTEVVITVTMTLVCVMAEKVTNVLQGQNDTRV